MEWSGGTIETVDRSGQLVDGAPGVAASGRHAAASAGCVGAQRLRFGRLGQHRESFGRAVCRLDVAAQQLRAHDDVEQRCATEPIGHELAQPELGDRHGVGGLTAEQVQARQWCSHRDRVLMRCDERCRVLELAAVEVQLGEPGQGVDPMRCRRRHRVEQRRQRCLGLGPAPSSSQHAGLHDPAVLGEHGGTTAHEHRVLHQPAPLLGSTQVARPIARAQQRAEALRRGVRPRALARADGRQGLV
ncbi:MAG: hypothetical protein HZB15_10535, partial [Actinobacteria bacterium]|nr:hypothetical protein [Actinomycetota bacterium]